MLPERPKPRIAILAPAISLLFGTLGSSLAAAALGAGLVALFTQRQRPREDAPS